MNIQKQVWNTRIKIAKIRYPLVNRLDWAELKMNLVKAKKQISYLFVFKQKYVVIDFKIDTGQTNYCSPLRQPTQHFHTIQLYTKIVLATKSQNDFFFTNSLWHKTYMNWQVKHFFSNRFCCVWNCFRCFCFEFIMVCDALN